jgi:hypothetical protein
MSRYRFALIASLLVVVLGICLASVAAQGQARSAPKKAAAAGPLPPIPFQGYPAPRPHQVVQSVYEFAARHPEVLQYVPCYCGCEQHGHVGNDDCFVRSRDSAGRVTWEPHGYG